MSDTEFRPKGPFPLYLKDFRQDTMGWSGEERYMYIELLDYLFHQGGFIPANDEIIAQVIGLNRARNWRSKLEKLKSKLFESEEKPGFLTQARVLAEVENANERSRLAQKAGRASGRKRSTDAGKHVGRSDEPKSNPPAPTPSPSPSVSKDTSGERARGTRLPPDWILPDEWREHAASAGHPKIDQAATRFRNHFTSADGPGAVKRDWFPAWKNWVGGDLERLGITPRDPTTAPLVPTEPEINIAPGVEPALARKWREAMTGMLASGAVPRETFCSWLNQTTLIGADDGRPILAARNDFVAQYIDVNLGGKLADAFGQRVIVRKCEAAA